MPRDAYREIHMYSSFRKSPRIGRIGYTLKDILSIFALIIAKRATASTASGLNASSSSKKGDRIVHWLWELLDDFCLEMDHCLLGERQKENPAKVDDCQKHAKSTI